MNLLLDRTTGCNIAWATDQYPFPPNSPIFPEHLHLIKPRHQKSKEAKKERTKKKAEVFTPTWVCNSMNNLIDEEWFGRKGVFNIEDGKTWTPTTEKITFPEGKVWQDYVMSTRLEITCGEAPFLVSRYEPDTGEPIPLERRIGILDRKLRIVNENADSWSQWRQWAFRALQSTYGYEYQGDNLYLARLNVLKTFEEYHRHRWHQEPMITDMRAATEIITWNLWQMDGLTGEVPGTAQKANIMDWELPEVITFASLKPEEPKPAKKKKTRRTKNDTQASGRG